MFKRVLFILVCIFTAGFAIYMISKNVMRDTADSANIRAIEEYADAIKLSTVNINNVMNEELKLNYDDINIGTNVKCEKIDVTSAGIIELYGCTVENSKTKYKYTSGKAKKE